MLATSTGLSGPPIVMLLTARRLAIGAFRSSIAAYFIVLSVVGLILLVGGHAIDRDDLTVSAVLVPAALVGTLAGSRLVQRLDAARFRKLTLVLLLSTGVFAVGTVIAALL